MGATALPEQPRRLLEIVISVAVIAAFTAASVWLLWGPF
jgi:hypothetical protein